MQNLRYPAKSYSIRAGSVNRLAAGVIHNIEKIVVNEHH